MIEKFYMYFDIHDCKYFKYWIQTMNKDKEDENTKLGW